MTNYFLLAKIELNENFKTTTTCHKQLHHHNNKDDEDDSNNKDGNNNNSNNDDDADDINHGPWPTEARDADTDTSRASGLFFFFG